MKLLLTNDDGIDAPGLAALRRATVDLGECRVIGPAGHWSGCSHQVTTDRPFRIHRRTNGELAVEGTPADCTRVALERLAPDVDWVIAGINAGGNLGADVFHSGTVAAVREAALHGKPGVAISHYRKKGREFDWDRAALWTTQVLRRLLQQPGTAGQFWNVNLPHLLPDDADPDICFCPLDVNPLPLSFRVEEDWFAYAGEYHQRRRTAGSDVDVCFRGQIAVTRLQLG